MAVRVTVQGSESLKRKLDGLSAAVRGEKLEQALVAGALIVQNDAKRRAPFLTGNLRRSIHIGGHADLAGDFQNTTGGQIEGPEISGSRVEVLVGTNVEYAWRIEYGFTGADALGRDINQAADPYLRPAIDENEGAVKREVSEALRDLLRAVI